MRAMKDSGIQWIGEIPETWETIKLKYLVALNTEKAPKENSGLPYVGLEHVVSYSGKLVNNYEENLEFTGDTITFLPKDVLFGKLRPYLSKVLQPQFPGRCSSEFWVMRPQSIQSKFLFYLVQSDSFVKCIDHSTLGVKMPRAEWSFAGNQKVAVPDKAEQIEIVDFLDLKCQEIDNLISAIEKLNKLLRERKQSVIFEITTKGLNANTLLKESKAFWLGQIPVYWNIAPLKYYASISTGVALGKKYKEGQELREFPYLRVANVQRGYVDLKDIAIIQLPENEANQYMLQPGNLLMTEGGDRDKLGRGCVWHGEIEPMLHQNHVFALTTNDKLNVEYLNYIIMSDAGKTYFDFTAKKTTNLASTNSTTIMNFKIPVPSRSEQDEIVAYLDKTCAEIDKVIEKNNSTIQKLKEYRQTLIYEAVTGKIEV